MIFIVPLTDWCAWYFFGRVSMPVGPASTASESGIMGGKMEVRFCVRTGWVTPLALAALAAGPGSLLGAAHFSSPILPRGPPGGALRPQDPDLSWPRRAWSPPRGGTPVERFRFRFRRRGRRRWERPLRAQGRCALLGGFDKGHSSKWRAFPSFLTSGGNRTAPENHCCLRLDEVLLASPPPSPGCGVWGDFTLALQLGWVSGIGDLSRICLSATLNWDEATL